MWWSLHVHCTVLVKVENCIEVVVLIIELLNPKTLVKLLTIFYREDLIQCATSCFGPYFCGYDFIDEPSHVNSMPPNFPNFFWFTTV